MNAIAPRAHATPITGTLYGSIKRMLEDGLIEEVRDTRPKQQDERRPYHRITSHGRKIAIAETARLATLLKQARASGLAPRSA
jgi:DNA-binding PadR family transcriptional regulator